MGVYLVDWLSSISVTVAVLAFVGFGLSGTFAGDRKNARLADLIVRSMAAAGIPTAVALIWCAYNPSDLHRLSDHQIYIAVAGLCLLYCSILSMVSETKKVGRIDTNQIQ